MPVAHVNGQSISYEDSGGGGPVLLFSHGYLMDSTMWHPQVLALEGLAPDYRCIRWDERGFGNTVATGPFTYWDSADDGVALLDELGVDTAVWVGMSQGGFLSLRAALAHPDRVSALVLVDSQAGVDDEATLESYRAMEHIVEQGSDDEFAAVLPLVAAIIIGDEAIAAPWIETWKGMDRAGSRPAFDALVERDDITGRLGEITCPALVVHGTADAAIPMARAEALAAGLPGSHGVVPIEGAGHASNLTHPDLVNPPLIEFLATLA